MKEINTISAEVYRERRKHLSCMVHSDLMQLCGKWRGNNDGV